MKIQLPVRPKDDEIPQLPLKLTELVDEMLMELFVKLTAWTNYLQGQLVRAEIAEAAAQTALDLAKAKFYSSKWTGQSGERVTMIRATSLVDPQVSKMTDAYHTKYQHRKLLGVMYGTTERNAQVISRELTRRVQNHSTETRVARWTP